MIIVENNEGSISRYVSSNGCDIFGDGTVDRPYLTIQRAQKDFPLPLKIGDKVQNTEKRYRPFFVQEIKNDGWAWGEGAEHPYCSDGSKNWHNPQYLTYAKLTLSERFRNFVKKIRKKFAQL